MGEGKRPNAAPLPKNILVAQGTQAAAKMFPHGRWMNALPKPRETKPSCRFSS
jgi:hypothetical protein